VKLECATYQFGVQNFVSPTFFRSQDQHLT